MQSLEKVDLTRLQSCNQIWENMTSKERGRICNKCQNTVIDFRKFTDIEIAEVHTFTEDIVCGLYTKKQLVGINQEPKKGRLKPFYFALLSIVTTMSISCENNILKDKTEQVEPNYKNRVNISIMSNIKNKCALENVIIYGQIKEKDVGGISFANVFVKESRNGVSADVNGYYRINVAKDFKNQNTITLIYKGLGFKSKSIRIEKSDILFHQKKINMSLQHSNSTAFYVATQKKSFYKRVLDSLKIKTMKLKFVNLY